MEHNGYPAEHNGYPAEHNGYPWLTGISARDTCVSKKRFQPPLEDEVWAVMHLHTDADCQYIKRREKKSMNGKQSECILLSVECWVTHQKSWYDFPNALLDLYYILKVPQWQITFKRLHYHPEGGKLNRRSGLRGEDNGRINEGNSLYLNLNPTCRVEPGINR